MMIKRSIALALLCACTYALSPLAPVQVVGDNSDCALYLNGPGRTSAYDYSINLLKGNFGYEGQANCITYEAVNQAYLEARNRILVAQPKGDWKAEDFASVGELILDISINLARRYGLTYEEIEKGLPLIDTSRTLIREVCPPVFSHVECRAGKYRRLDGLCNNLQHPTWGATMAPFQRLIGPLFADGINAPRIAHHGRDLPLSRVVSRTMHPDEGFHDHAGTVMVIAWGQFMDHDYTLTATPLDPINRNDPEECCKRPPHLKHPYCNEIRIPDDDYFYRLFGVKCIDFVRGFPSPRPGCRLGSRVPYNTLTGAIDGNTVYGVTEKFARKLRTGFGGLLRMNPVFKEYGLKDLLPLKLDIPDEGCTRPNKNMYCFEAGEIRVNEQLVLTVMHTLMAREHNRVANALAEVNPHWDDETLFQEARRINIAEIQHITYNEFLPILLGKDVMEKFGLVLEKESYWDGYDPEVNPDVIASFAAAAYRFGHSLLPTAVERWSKAHKFIASKRLSDLIRRPYDLYRAGVLDEYVMGLMNQVAQAMDDSITQEVTNHLFKKVGARFGMDLVSFNMQRGREFGLPGYMEFRKFCGLPHADSFQDLFGSMPNQTVQKYETIFDHPIDVDLWSGGVSERPLPGSMLGPTFACIIATQFSYSRRGDRFWFELPNQPSSFTPEQLAEIRKSRLARVICDNTDIIDTVQLYPMVLPDHELNPRVPCRSGIIPQMDFSKWAEPAPFHGGAAKQFMTNATIVENNVTKKEELIKDEKDCNQTEITETATPNPTLILLQAENLNTTAANSTISFNNTVSGNEPSTIINNNEKELSNNKTATNEITNKDTVLKYVYKESDKIKTFNKGHYKNSLERRKRSATDPLSPLPSKFQNPGLIVNYETSHAPTASTDWSPPLANIKERDLANFNVETRHDNAEVGNEDNVHRPYRKDSSEVSLRNSDSNESSERDENKRRENENNIRDSSSRESNDESGEQRTHNKNQNYSTRNENSAESTESDYRNNAKYLSPQESLENNESTKLDARSTENKESAEKDNYTSSEKSSDESRENTENGQYNQSPRNKESSNEDSGESNDRRHSHSSKPYESRESYQEQNKENYQSGEAPQSSDEGSSENNDGIYSQESRSHGPVHYNDQTDTKQNQLRENQSSNENSNESREKETNVPRHSESLNSELRNRDNKNASRPLQNIDLGDFSYERINLNENGKVVAANDNHETLDPNSAVEILHPNTKPEKKEHDILQLVTNIHTPLKEYSDKLIHINDGEVRPVIEIPRENDDDSNEDAKGNLSNSESLETLLEVKEPQNIDSSEHNGKIVAQQELEKGDVKQQYERIPLNYNHDQKDQLNDNQSNDTPKSDDFSKAEEAPTRELAPKKEFSPKVEYSSNEEHASKSKDAPEEDIADKNPEGTVDVFAPQKFDENLNIKFEDIQLKLPEIKLPDDILAFTKAHSSFKNEDDDEDDRKSPYRYNQDRNSYNKDEPRRPKNKKDDDDDEEDDRDSGPAYYGYYGGDDRKNEKYKEKKEVEDENEDEVDLYEKFVRERFGKRGTFGKRYERLEDRPLNPELTKTIQNILQKTAVIDEQAKKSGDPNAGYMWTLEYGENL